jgi:hypothetical protein
MKKNELSLSEQRTGMELHVTSISITSLRPLSVLSYCATTLYFDIHSIHTRQGLDLHYLAYKLTKVQKGVSFTGIRIFNI